MWIVYVPVAVREFSRKVRTLLYEMHHFGKQTHFFRKAKHIFVLSNIYGVIGNEQSFEFQVGRRYFILFGCYFQFIQIMNYNLVL